MKENSKNTILFRQREEHHISKYRFTSNQNGKSDFKVIPYPKYKKITHVFIRKECFKANHDKQIFEIISAISKSMNKNKK